MCTRLQNLLVFKEPLAVVPEPTAVAHREWDKGLESMRPRGVRSFAGRHDLEIDDSIKARFDAEAVRAHAQAIQQPYRPSNLPYYPYP